MLYTIVAALLWIAKVVIGIGLLWNCTRGLLSREGMYDRESTQMMQISQIAGIFFGAFLLASALGFVDIPGLPFF